MAIVRIALVEDDPIYQKQILDFLSRFEAERGESFQVTTFTDGHEIAFHYDGSYDILLMDIELGVMNGMEAAEAIRKLDSEVVIIFITNLPQYAIRGYAVEALDYILKPLSYYPFSQRLGRAIERMGNRKERFLGVNMGRGQVKKLAVSSIHYVEVREHILIYHTSKEDVTVSGTMREVESQLCDKGFFRCNKGFLINLEHVQSIRDDCAIVGGESIQISRAKKKPFIKALNDYIGEVEK